MQLLNSYVNSSQRRACILDLPLALSPVGVTLAKNLSQITELWVVRELWHILDNIALYLQNPKLITPRRLIEGEVGHDQTAITETIQSLQHWQCFRMEHDLRGLGVFWLGDSLRESILPQSRPFSIFQHWEAIAESLDSQLDSQFDQSLNNNLLSLAIRDTTALMVCLESAFVLTCQPLSESEENSVPEICQLLDAWGIPCQELAVGDAIVEMECTFLRKLFIQMGLTHLLWQSPRLIAFYISVPNDFNNALNSTESPLSSRVAALRKPTTHQKRDWNRAKGFWYTL